MNKTCEENIRLFRGLALLLHAGIGAAEGLYILGAEASGSEGQRLEKLGRAMDGGAALSEAMVDFPAFDVGMVRTGEQTGRLEEALNALAEHYDQRQRTAHMLKTALVYPCTVLALMLVVLGVLVVKVLPVFDKVYASLGSGLTGFAGGMLRLGEILQGAMPLLLGLLLVAAVTVVLFALWDAFREKATFLWRKGFGDRGILRKFNNARFAQALAMGLQSGMLPEAALELACTLLTDVPEAARRCETCLEAVKKGADLPDALGQGAFLDASMARLLAVGLRGGNADRVMGPAPIKPIIST